MCLFSDNKNRCGYKAIFQEMKINLSRNMMSDCNYYQVHLWVKIRLHGNYSEICYMNSRIPFSGMYYNETLAMTIIIKFEFSPMNRGG